MLTPLHAESLVVLGILPSLVWLTFYLKQDRNPEPKSMISKTFLMGIILSPLAILFQAGFGQLSQIWPSPIFEGSSAAFFLWAALVEEVVKFSAVWFIVLKSPEFDEPVDAMIYLITAGLGFAAIENILVLFRTIPNGASAAFTIWTLRSVGATLLHALSCAITGYFLAMAWFFQHHRKKLILVGLVLATMFHFTFNMFLAAADGQLRGLGLATSLLGVMSFLVSMLFAKIKERHIQHQARLAALTNSEVA
ncbi:PrsW family intramembrane metalloprotease [Candidatus Parcubacteria bacterium]|nr:PrsW family intramembrane metalloprotease [Candidatus Parcubacteria bacterium]